MMVETIKPTSATSVGVENHSTSHVGTRITSAEQYGATSGYFIERPNNPADVPMEDAKAMLVEYAKIMHGRLTSAGGPDFSWQSHVDSFWAGFDRVFPPNGSYLLVRDETGALVGTATLLRASDDTGEMKHLYVRSSARRAGLGEALVKARIEDARDLGLRYLIADTFKINPELPSLYAKMGFQKVPPSSTSKSATISPEIEDWMWFYRLNLSQ